MQPLPRRADLLEFARGKSESGELLLDTDAPISNRRTAGESTRCGLDLSHLRLDFCRFRETFGLQPKYSLPIRVVAKCEFLLSTVPLRGSIRANLLGVKSYAYG